MKRFLLFVCKDNTYKDMTWKFLLRRCKLGLECVFVTLKNDNRGVYYDGGYGLGLGLGFGFDCEC